MIKTVLVGGVKSDEIGKAFEGTKLDIVKEYNFVEDLFADILKNPGEFLDVDAVVVLQYGIKQEKSEVEQIRSIQEAYLVQNLKSKLFIILKDLDFYKYCEENVEDVLVYENSRIMYLTKMTTKHIVEVVEGIHDRDSISLDVDTENDIEYFEDEVKESKLNLEKEDEINIQEEIDEPKDDKKLDLDALRGKKPKDKKSVKKATDTIKEKVGVLNLFDKEEFKLPQRESQVKEVTSRFRGVLAVTGDRGSGVSTIAANLAEAMALQGDTVVILDMDLEKRFQSVLFPNLTSAEREFTNTQVGVYTVLNNPDMVEDVLVVVEDNLGLIGMSREDKYYLNRFADKNIDEIVTSHKILGALGVLKGLFDVVIIDYPIDYIEKYLESTIIIDKFVICVENSIPMIENILNIRFRNMFNNSDVYTRSIYDKSGLILNKFNKNSTYRRQVIDSKFIEGLLRNQLYGDIQVLGEIGYHSDFVKQLYSGKRAISFNQNMRDSIQNIIENLGA